MSGGTNPVATYGPTNFTTQTATAYKTQIDANSMVAQRVVDCFAPRQSNTPAMTVTLDPGYIFRGTTVTEVAAQTTGTITAPAGNPRIDRVVVDRMTGAASVVTGTPGASPTPPAIPNGKVPICQLLIQSTSLTITNAMITDERTLDALGRGTAGEENIGQWLKDDGSNNLTLNVNATLRDDGAGKLTTGLTAAASITATSTTNLGSLASNIIAINGSGTVTSLGNSASIANPLYFTLFNGAAQLTHNATSLILIGGANITTAAGATATWLYLGSGNWRMLSYEPVLSSNMLIGVGSTGGKAAISLGTGLSMSGSTLNAGSLPLSASSSLSTPSSPALTTSFQDISGLDVTITPTTTSDKVHVSGLVFVGAPVNAYVKIQILRGVSVVWQGSGFVANSAGAFAVPFDFIDAPASVSAQTYKAQIAANSSFTGYINRDNAGTSEALTSTLNAVLVS